MDHKSFLSWAKNAGSRIDVSSLYFAEMMHLLFTRSMNTEIPFWELIEHLGAHASEILATENYEDEGYTESCKCFYLHLGFLIKFLYPMMEQLQMTVDKNIILVDCDANHEKD